MSITQPGDGDLLYDEAHEDALDRLEEELKKFGIIEMVRTGKVVMARGKEPT